MDKKGQTDSSSSGMLMVLGGIIVLMVLIVGYGLVSKSDDTFKKVSMLQLQSKLSSDISSLGQEYGSYRKLSYTAPTQLTELCLVDISRKEDVLTSKLIEHYALIKDSLTSGSPNNVFYMGENLAQTSGKIKGISMSHFPHMNCFRPKERSIDMGIEGRGGGEVNVLANFKTAATIDPSQETVLSSVDEIMSITVPSGNAPGTITVEMREATPDEKSTGKSDVYVFEPSGYVFNPPAIFSMKFSPSLFPNGCPSSLTFRFFGSTDTILESSSVDCENHIAQFPLSQIPSS